MRDPAIAHPHRVLLLVELDQHARSIKLLGDAAVDAEPPNAPGFVDAGGLVRGRISAGGGMAAGTAAAGASVFGGGGGGGGEGGARY